MSCCVHGGQSISPKPTGIRHLIPPTGKSDGFFLVPRRWKPGVAFSRICRVRASTLDSHEGPSPSSFVKRMEQAWLISQQPRPVACSTCNSNRIVECKWCGGTGFFMLGDNMLCQIPSRSTSCVICAGKGSRCCPDCKGTGFRARWLEEPQTPKE
ncbi:hypothetical protein Dimus_010938 [Dionaea muscipula]